MLNIFNVFIHRLLFERPRLTEGDRDPQRPRVRQTEKDRQTDRETGIDTEREGQKER